MVQMECHKDVELGIKFIKQAAYENVEGVTEILQQLGPER